MKIVGIALGAYYAGVVAPIAWSPFIFLGLLLVTLAIGWANLIEASTFQGVPLARARRRRRP